MRTLLLAVILLPISAPISLFAHDMWIEPTVRFPQPGQIVGLKLRVGQQLLGDPLPRQASLVKQFFVEDSDGRRPVIGREGGDPAGMVMAKAGLGVVGYESNFSPVEMDEAKFDAYLKEEGLDQVAAERLRAELRKGKARTANQGSAKPATVHEVFSRCAKLLWAPGNADGADRKLGFALELVAERNPFSLAADTALPVRLYFQDQPLAGALVVAINRGDPKARIEARTDRHGRVTLPVSGGGLWLIKAVHMVRASVEQKADWASFWASLTFERPSAAAAQSGGY